MSGEQKFVYEPSWSLSFSDFSISTSESYTIIRLNKTVEENVKTSRRYFRSKLMKGRRLVLMNALIIAMCVIKNFFK